MHALLEEVLHKGFTITDIGLPADPKDRLIRFVSFFGGVVEKQPILGQPKAGFTDYAIFGSNDSPCHTDQCWQEQPTRLLVLYCIQPESSGGGKTLVSNVNVALQDLGRTDLAELERVEYTFHSYPKKPKAEFRSAILTKRGEVWSVRFHSRLVREPLRDSAVALQSAITRCAETFLLTAGQAILIDNHYSLHGRTALRDGLNSDRKMFSVRFELP